MSNPTNPFGWIMPTAVDLVTDLPADFEVFGQAVATSMGDLLGGTTGQVLSKASNADMDFTFITPGVGDVTGVTAGTGITVADPTGPVPTVTNSMATAIDAKGDLIVGTGADAFSRLAVGATNGHVLTVDSAEATGLKYAAGGSIPNYQLINAGGTSLSGSSVTVSGISGKESLIIQIGDSAGPTLTNSSTFASFRMRINGDTGTNYNFIDFYRINSATPETGNQSSAGEDHIALGNFGGTANSHSIFANIMMFGCGAAGKKSVQFNSNASGTGKSIQGTAIYAGTSAVSSLTFFSSAGTNSAAKVYIYGA